MAKAKKSKISLGSENEEIWLVRSPGGPTRLVRSNRVLTEDSVKEIYLSQLKAIRTSALDDPDAKWPYLKRTTIDDVKSRHSWLLLESRRKNHRGVIDVIDGEVVDNKKPLPEIKKTATRVETRTG
jgi:hypothetical protein